MNNRIDSVVSIAKKLMGPLDNEYHNLDHAEVVSMHALSLARGENLNDHEKDLIQVTSYLHDIGYIYGPKDHEERSAELARYILAEFGYTLEEINRVDNAIRATKVPHPKVDDPVAQCVADADVASLGYDHDMFVEFCERVRDEWEPEMEIVEWYREYTLPLMKSIEYHTDTASDRWGEPLRRNQEWVRSKVEEE